MRRRHDGQSRFQDLLVLRIGQCAPIKLRAPARSADRRSAALLLAAATFAATAWNIAVSHGFAVRVARQGGTPPEVRGRRLRAAEEPVNMGEQLQCMRLVLVVPTNDHRCIAAWAACSISSRLSAGQRDLASDRRHAGLFACAARRFCQSAVSSGDGVLPCAMWGSWGSRPQRSHSSCSHPAVCSLHVGLGRARDQAIDDSQARRARREC